MSEWSDRRKVWPQDIQSALNSPGQEVVLEEALESWPISVMIGANSEAHASRNLDGHRVLVIATPLGDQPIAVPQFFLTRTVVVYLRNCRTMRRYGYLRDLYRPGDSASWEGSVASDAAKAAIDLIESLVDLWKCTGGVSIVGYSAGCVKAWAVLAEASSEFISKSLHCLVNIAGAWHPELLKILEKKLQQSTALVVTHHHESDSLSNWSGELSAYWSRLQSSFGDRVAVLILSGNVSAFVGECFHDISAQLCGLKAFWSLLAIAPSPTPVNLCEYANKWSLGRAFEALPDLHVNAGVESIAFQSTECVSILAGLVLSCAGCKASELQCSLEDYSHISPNAHPALRWIEGVAYWIRDVENHIQNWESHTCLVGLGLAASMGRQLIKRIQCRVLEALLAQLDAKSSGMLFGERVVGKNVSLVMHGMVQEMALVEITFPDNESVYLDFDWTSARQPSDGVGVTDFVPARPQQLPGAPVPVSPDSLRHHQHHRGCAAAEEGLSQGDFMNVLLQPADMKSSGVELLVFVKSSVPRTVKRKNQPRETQHSKIRCITGWVSYKSYCRVHKMSQEASSLALVLASVIVAPIGKVLRGFPLWPRALKYQLEVASALGGHRVVCEEKDCPKPRGLMSLWASHYTNDAALDNRFLQVSQIWQQRPEEPLVLLSGPPGTGKTTSMALLLMHLRHYAQLRDKPCRTLHLGQSNASVAAQYRSIMEVCPDIDPKQIIVIRGLLGVPTTLNTLGVSGRDASQWSACIENSPILHVFSTTYRMNSNGEAYTSSWDYLRGIFDVVFLDEAAHDLTEDDIHIPDVMSPDGRFIQVGDPRQLPPFTRRGWGVLSPMQAARRYYAPRLLQVQRRQPVVLGDFHSTVFYEGVVQNSSDAKIVKHSPLLLVSWPDWQGDSHSQADYPAEPEAALAHRIFQKLSVLYPRLDVVILCFYSSQMDLLLTRGVPPSVIKTVDSFQGGEADIVICSVGRWKGIGFLRCRRRLNVAFSRARFAQIVLVNDDVGSSSPRVGDLTPSNWWACLRSFFRRLSLEFRTGCITQWSDDWRRVSSNLLIEPVVDQLCSRVQACHTLSGEIVRAKVSASEPIALQSTFDNYQLDVVGSLAGVDCSFDTRCGDDSLGELANPDDASMLSEKLPEVRSVSASFPEVDCPSQTCIEHDNPETMADVENVSTTSEMLVETDSGRGPVQHDNDKENLCQSHVLSETSRSQVSVGTLICGCSTSHSTFAQVVVKDLLELLRLGTLELSHEARAEVLETRGYFPYMLRGFAQLLRASLAWYYSAEALGDNGEPLVDVNENIFAFARVPPVSIHQSVWDCEHLHQFLQAICGARDGEQTSPFFWQTHANPQLRPSMDMRRRYWTFLLPYSLVWPMLARRNLIRGCAGPSWKRQCRDEALRANSFVIPLDFVDERMVEWVKDQRQVRSVTLTPFNPLNRVRQEGQVQVQGLSVGELFVPWPWIIADAGSMPDGWLAKASEATRSI